MPGAGSGDNWILEPDRAPQRATVYWVLMVVLLLGGFLIRGFPENEAEQIHFLSEVVATILAVLVGALALVRYYSKKDPTFLFIGTGFLGTAFLDAYHLLVTSALFQTMVALPRPEEDLRAWSWIASRVFLSLFLMVSWLNWRQESRLGGTERHVVDEKSVYITATLLTLIIFVFFSAAPLSQAIYPDAAVPRPADLIPALFFSVALVGYFVKGSWRSDPFEHWLIIGLLVSVLLHGAFAAFSRDVYDAAFSAAHLLKGVSYVAILVGLMASVFVTFRREESAFDLSRRANDALAREVAVRRQAERVLQESEEGLQDFLDSANDLILMTQLDGTIDYVNRAWRRRLGYGATELAGRSFFEMVDPSAQQSLERAYEAAARGDAIAGLELRLRSSQEEEVIVRGSLNCRFENGEPVAVRTMLRDVTDQKRAQEELALSEANLTALVESTGDAIWSVGPDAGLITFNAAYSLAVEALTGNEPQVGSLSTDLVLGDDIPLFQEFYRKGLSGERFSDIWEVELAGQWRAFELYFNPISDGLHTVGIVVFSKDVTRRMRAEVALRAAKDEAEHANRAKSQFLANMSHELRTPLNSVIGFANILLKRKGDALNEKDKSFLERILANGKHLLELINEILDLAKIEAGRMDVELQEVDLGEFIGETLGQLEAQVRDRPVDLVGSVPPSLTPLETDPGKLKQVIINLVGNALRFTAEGAVTVEVETDSDHPLMPQRIHVHDTGPGIPADRLEAIFEAFQQADGSTARQYGGTGLGLSISRSLCHLLGYHISVASVVDEGSTFTINLNTRVRTRTSVAPEDAAVLDEELEAVAEDPAEATSPDEAAASQPAETAEPAALEADAPAPTAKPAKKKKGRAPARVELGEDAPLALVIDDEEDVRIYIQAALEDLGCRVITADGGREGLRTAREHLPDVITLDLQMPDMGGWEVLQTLKAETNLQSIPVIVVSVEAQEGRARVFGAVDLLSKPVDKDVLREVLARALQTP